MYTADYRSRRQITLLRKARSTRHNAVKHDVNSSHDFTVWRVDRVMSWLVPEYFRETGSVYQQHRYFQGHDCKVLERSFDFYTICTLDLLYPRPFVPYIDYSYPWSFIPWTVRPPTPFIPCIICPHPKSFRTNVDRSHPGPSVYAKNGPGYEWSTLNMNIHGGHHRTILSGYIFATKARIDNRKKTC